MGLLPERCCWPSTITLPVNSSRATVPAVWLRSCSCLVAASQVKMDAELVGEAYEAHVNRTRAEKQALLQKLSLPTGKSSPAGRAGRPKKTNLQRKTPLEPLRKSARLSSVKEKSLLHPPDGYSDSGDDSESYVEDVARSSRKRKLGGGPRSHNPTGKIYKKIIGPDPAKSFGSVPGINVGHWWEMRIHAGNARIHPPPVSGIFGTPEVGCYSIAVSAGYPEDEDNGDTFTYTGSGGRDLKTKNLRTGPQSSNQKLEGPNAALAKSVETGNPIRVIRGFKAALGPGTGYRYDGLYRATRAWEEVGSTGKYTVWRFSFERLPSQEPIDYNAGGPKAIARPGSSEYSDADVDEDSRVVSVVSSDTGTPDSD